MAALSRLGAVAVLLPPGTDYAAALRLGEAAPEIRFEGVRFAYPGGGAVLRAGRARVGIEVVDIADEETGTVRLKRSVDKADEMALDTASTKTTRIRG